MIKTKKKNEKVIAYLIVRCYPLNDPWECEYDRVPTCVVTDYSNYSANLYEVYAICADGKVKIERKCAF